MRRLVGMLTVVLVFGTLGAASARLVDTFRLYVVRTGSMAPAYAPGDVVIDRRDANAIRPGDVITFQVAESSPELVTHRLVSLGTDGTATTKGDANDSPDPWTVHRGLIQGEVVGRIPGAGYVVVYLQHPTGLMSLATTVFCVVLLWGLFFPGPTPAPTTSTTKPEPTAVAEAVA